MPTMITKIKVTWTATAVQPPPHRDLVWDPANTAQLVENAWTAPNSFDLGNHEWTHPWNDPQGQPVGIDRLIWAQLIELPAIDGRVEPPFVKRMRDRAIPLRAPLDVASPGAPGVGGVATDWFGEVFLVPWGATCAITATLDCNPALGLPAVAEAVAACGAAPMPASAAGIGGAPVPHVVEELAQAVAQQLRVGSEPEVVAPGRIATVIDATWDVAPDTTSQQFADAMWDLTGSPAPGYALRWVKSYRLGDPSCLPSDVQVLTRTGVAQWSQTALENLPTRLLERTVALHRNALLRWASLSAVRGLLAHPSDVPWLQTLRRDLALYLGRLTARRDGTQTCSRRPTAILTRLRS